MDLRCQACQGTDFVDDHDAGESICTNCGTVAPERLIVPEQEWRSFTSESERSKNRVSRSDYLAGESKKKKKPKKGAAGGASGAAGGGDGAGAGGVGAGAGGGGGGAGGAGAGGGAAGAQGRGLGAGGVGGAGGGGGGGGGGGAAKEEDDRAGEEQRKKQIREAREAIQQIGEGKLPGDVLERAAEIAKNVIEVGIKGHKKNVVNAVCLFFACNELGANRTMKEMCKMTQVLLHEFRKCYKVVRNTLDMRTGPTSARDMVPRLCDALGIRNEKHKRACTRLADHLNDMQQGRNPGSIAAASLFLVTREIAGFALTLTDICSHAGVTDTTVTGVVKTAQEKDIDAFVASLNIPAMGAHA